MSFTIDQAHVKKYEANVYHLPQQGESRLRDAVTMAGTGIVGTRVFFERIGTTTVEQIVSRHGDTPFNEIDHTKRAMDMKDFQWGNRTDRFDIVRTLIDPNNEYTIASRRAFARKIDSIIIDAFDATVTTQADEAGTAAFDTDMDVALNYVESGSPADSNLTVGKLRRAKYLLDANEVMPDRRHLAITASALQSLLRNTEVTSHDYNTVKTLVMGEVDTFLGFKIHQTELLPFIGASITDKYCFAWQEDAIKLGFNDEPFTQIAQDPSKRFDWVIYTRMGIGALRMDELSVARIAIGEDL